jgi:Fe-S cluster biosynthesis and repair protein YggX
MDIQQRIGQWENMTQADPDNAMGWFSLGTAYKDAGRPEDAVGALQTCLEKDATYSRAYQLLGQMLIDLGRRSEAGEVLTKGYTVAASRGDVMPQKAMGVLLEEKLGQPVPEVETKDVEAELGEGMLVDRRTGQPGHRLPDPPMRGPVGQFIFDHYSAETWREWIGMGTKVINEFRLDFSNPEHQAVYDQQMMEWLGFTQEEVDQHAKQ